MKRLTPSIKKPVVKVSGVKKTPFSRKTGKRLMPSRKGY